VVCGAPSDKFEAFGEEKSAKKDAVSKWKCLVCNHLHEGDGPPDSCPVCGAGTRNFEPVAPPKDSTSDTATKRRIVIVGAGIAGVSAAEAARDQSPAAEITLISKEANLPYYRLNLTRLLAREVDEPSLPIHNEAWFSENRIELILGAEVTEIQPDVKAVTLRDGRRILFDRLILTAGAHPFIPPVPGAQKNGVTTLRSLDQVLMISRAAQLAKAAVVIGGGILGLEAAAALKAVAPNLSVTVVEGFEYLMPRQLNRKAAARLKNHVEKLGILLETGTSVKEIEGDERVASIVLGNGKSLAADLVIFAAGVRPNSYLARTTGLKVNQGVIVDDYMETSIEGIYAAGDIAEHRGVLYGLWNAAMYQGAIAGMNAAGKRSGFGGIPRSNTIKVLGVDLFSIGAIEPCDGSCTVIEKENDAVYISLLFRDGNLQGAILYGDTSQSTVVKKAIEEKKDFSRVLSGEPGVDKVLSA
jgi:nitrite reductase (NADH) large subunit